MGDKAQRANQNQGESEMKRKSAKMRQQSEKETFVKTQTNAANTIQMEWTWIEESIVAGRVSIFPLLFRQHQKQQLNGMSLALSRFAVFVFVSGYNFH